MASFSHQYIYPEVLLNAVHGDHRTFRRLLETYLRISPPMLARLDAAVSGNDSKAAALESHTLKGTAALIGALELAQKLELIEHAAKTGAQIAGTVLYADMKTEFHAVSEEVKDTMARPVASDDR